MALTDLISSVANKTSYKVTSAVVTSNDPTTKQLLALLQSLNQDVMELYDWPALLRSGTITLVDGQSLYDLPADFSYHHYDTFWNQNTDWPLYGSLSTQEYSDIKGPDYNVSAQSRFIIRGLINKQVEISPVPDSSSAGQVLYFLYQSARYVKPITWAQGLTFTSGDYCHYKNNYYISSTTGTSGATPPTHTSGSVTDGTITWAYTDNPYTTFIKDPDSPVFKQRIIE
jgi:hypothetical protein